MNNFFVMMSTMSMAGTLLFGMVLLLSKFIKNNCIKHVYILMKLVLLFYTLPALLITNIAYNQHMRLDTIVLKTPDFQFVKHSEELRSIELVDNYYLSNLDNTIFMIWLLGFIFFYVIGMIYAKIKLNRILEKSHAVKEQFILDIKNDILLKENIKRTITLYQTELVSSPFTTGLYNMKIILPEGGGYEQKEWRMMLHHEMIHCKNHDVLFKLLVGMVQKIHWFNPVIFLFKQKFYELSEFACDYETLEDCDKEQRMEYGYLIIRMAEEKPVSNFIVKFSTISEKLIKRRLQNIMKKNKNQKSIVFTTTIVAFLLACPIATYASATASSYLHDEAVRIYQKSNSVLGVNRALDNAIGTEAKVNSGKPISYIGNLNERGINQIDFTLGADGEAQFSELYLTVGASVRIVLSGDKTTDSFRAGIISENGKRKYVNSSDGTVSYTFKISADGTYIVYLEGGNSSSDIHLLGTIYVNY